MVLYTDSHCGAMSPGAYLEAGGSRRSVVDWHIIALGTGSVSGTEAHIVGKPAREHYGRRGMTSKNGTEVRVLAAHYNLPANDRRGYNDRKGYYD